MPRLARRAVLGIAIALCTALAPPPAQAEIRLDVRAQPTSLSIGDLLNLQISVQARGLGAPDVSLPEFEGFEIVSQQVQRPMQFSFSFGQRATVQSSTIYTFVLQPLREGRLTIEPVRVELDGEIETSRPVVVSVSGGSGQVAHGGGTDPGASQSSTPPAANTKGTIDSAEIDDIAFLRTLVSKAEPYEGEQTTITIYLYVRDRLQSTPSIETEPTTDGLWVHDLLPPARQLQPTRQLVNGRPYAVYVLRRVAAFPLHSGEITIGPMAVEIDTSSLFDIFSPRRARSTIERTSKPVVLHVRALPEQGRPPDEVAVGRYALAAKLDRAQAVTGDAVTLTATVQGQGNIRTVALELPDIAGLDILQPEIKDLVTAPDDLVSGTREYRWLIVPRAPGHYTIPAIGLSTFDPNTGSYERVTTEPLALEAVGQALATADSQPRSKDAPAVAESEGEDAAAQDDHVWAPIRTQSELARDHARLIERPWYGWALAAPGLIWLTAASVLSLRRRAGERARTGKGRDLRNADQRAQSAAVAARDGDASRFYAEASAALLAALEARLQEPVSGFTRAQLREYVRARGMDDALLSELLQALERAEFARFSSAADAAADLQAQDRTMQALFRRLLAFTPKEAA